MDFWEVESITFPPEGSSLTPAHHYSEFRYKIYAPIAFRYFRDLFGIQPDDFMVSIPRLYLIILYLFPAALVVQGYIKCGCMQIHEGLGIDQFFIILIDLGSLCGSIYTCVSMCQSACASVLPSVHLCDCFSCFLMFHLQITDWPNDKRFETSSDRTIFSIASNVRVYFDQPLYQ